MNTNQLGILLANDKVDVTITTYLYSSDEERWRCTLNKKDDCVDLSIYHQAADIDSAMMGAYEKYSRVVNKGIPEFSGPLLEHKKEEWVPPSPPSDFHHDLDDEIPF